MEQNAKKKKLKMFLPIAAIVIVIAIVAIYWYNDYSSYITTDDAHVDADFVSLSSKIPGRVIKLYANEWIL